MTYFGQAYFGHDQLWPRPTLATTCFRQADFGHNPFNLANLGRFLVGPGRFWPTLATRLGLADFRFVEADFGGPGRLWWGQEDLGQRTRPPLPRTPSPQDRPLPDRPAPDPLRRTAQNFALLFPSPARISRFFCLWVFSWNLVVFWSVETLKCARFSPSGCRVKAPTT